MSLPKVHIVLASIEKVVPTLDDAWPLLRLLARSATGQEITAYTTLSPGRAAPATSTVPRLATSSSSTTAARSCCARKLRPVLRCIRCGACMNHCPVYCAIGGHAYGSVYPGPIGAVLTPALGGHAEAGHLAQASTFCGRCEEVCPVEIPLVSLMRHWREMAVDAAGLEVVCGPLLRAWAWLAEHPRAYRPAAASLRQRSAGSGARAGSLSPLPFAERVDAPPRFSGAAGTHVPGSLRAGKSARARMSREHILGAHPCGARRATARGARARASTADRLARPPEHPRPPEHGGRRASSSSSSSHPAALGVDLIEVEARSRYSRRHRRLSVGARAAAAPAPRRATRCSQRCRGRRARSSSSISARRADGDTVGLSRAVAGVAETGTLALASGADNPVTLGFLPDTHIVVLRADRDRRQLRGGVRAGARRAGGVDAAHAEPRHGGLAHRRHRRQDRRWARMDRGGSPVVLLGNELKGSYSLRQLCRQLEYCFSQARRALGLDAALIVGVGAAASATAFRLGSVRNT